MSEGPASAPELVEVRLVGVSLSAYREASEHHDELRREFALLGDLDDPERDVPRRLLALLPELEARFAAFTAAPMSELEVALAGTDEGTIDLVFQVPPQAKEACMDFSVLLDEADEFCMSGRELLTLATPPRALAFRRWFLGEFVRQIDGQPPRPWSGPAGVPSAG